MRILGIDPGVATVGFGVIDSEGGRQRSGTEPLPPRRVCRWQPGWCRSKAIWSS